MSARSRKTRVVPSLVLTATFVGVIPACALAACGGQTTSQDGGSDANNNDVFSVADIGFIPDATPADADAETDAPSDAQEGG